MAVRTVRPDELATVAELTVRAYVVGNGIAPDAPYTTQLRRVGERAAASPLLVATRGAQIVGAVSVCPYGTEWSQIAAPDEVELRMLVVEPAAFGTGVGDALVEGCLELSRQIGANRIVLSVVADNSVAHGLYVRHGFGRDPKRDWTPVPGVQLLGYSRDLLSTAS